MSGLKNLAACPHLAINSVLSLTLRNTSVVWAYYLTALGFSFPIGQTDSTLCTVYFRIGRTVL